MKRSRVSESSVLNAKKVSASTAIETSQSICVSPRPLPYLRILRLSEGEEQRRQQLVHPLHVLDTLIQLAEHEEDARQHVAVVEGEERDLAAGALHVLPNDLSDLFAAEGRRPAVGADGRVTRVADGVAFQRTRNESAVLLSTRTVARENELLQELAVVLEVRGGCGLPLGRIEGVAAEEHFPKVGASSWVGEAFETHVAYLGSQRLEFDTSHSKIEPFLKRGVRARLRGVSGVRGIIMWLPIDRKS